LEQIQALVDDLLAAHEATGLLSHFA